MKGLAIVLVACLGLLGSAYANEENYACDDTKITDFPTGWREMHKNCINKVKEQIHKELNASITYLAMGSHFAKDTINRPGFADLFFKAASEEREHAIKLIQYLLMRGQFGKGITDVISPERVFRIPHKSTWSSGAEALAAALDLEAAVTTSIRTVIEYCEDACKKSRDDTCQNFNDYHLVDYLTGDFLEEQYKGQRDLAGKLSILKKMMNEHRHLGEFLFDKKLLNGEVM